MCNLHITFIQHLPYINGSDSNKINQNGVQCEKRKFTFIAWFNKWEAENRELNIICASGEKDSVSKQTANMIIFKQLNVLVMCSESTSKLMEMWLISKS